MLADDVLVSSRDRPLSGVIGRITSGVLLNDLSNESGDAITVVFRAASGTLDERGDERLVSAVIEHQGDHSLDSNSIWLIIKRDSEKQIEQD